MKGQTLTIDQMRHLKKLGVDTSKASMVLIFFDEECNEIGWEVRNYVEDRLWYEYYDEESEIWKTATPEYLCAETGRYDHSYRKDCGVFTLQDILEILPACIEKNEYWLTIEKDISSHGKCFHRVSYSNFADINSVKYRSSEIYLLEAAYLMLCWVAEHGYLRKEGE